MATQRRHLPWGDHVSRRVLHPASQAGLGVTWPRHLLIGQLAKDRNVVVVDEEIVLLHRVTHVEVLSSHSSASMASVIIRSRELRPGLADRRSPFLSRAEATGPAAMRAKLVRPRKACLEYGLPSVASLFKYIYRKGIEGFENKTVCHPTVEHWVGVVSDPRFARSR